MREEYDSLVEAIRDMRQEFKNAEHFIVNPEDAIGSDLPLHFDDEGTPCFIVDHILVYAHDDCPPGTIGAAVPDFKTTTNIVGIS